MELHPGEHVIYEGHPSWRALFGFYFLGLIVAAGVGVIAAIAASTALGAAIGVGVFVLVLVVGYLRRITTRYLITNRRLQIRRGLLSKNIEETRVDRVVDVTVRQSVWARVLAIGSVDFDNASAQQGDLFRFVGIASPHEVTQAINQVHEEERAGAGQAQV
jgi:uncharacterized membrane protein YdbT with pleckstrin-like domain